MGKTPPDLLDRRVEITGPVDRKMVINALELGRQGVHGRLRGCQHSPTWANDLEGQINLRDADPRSHRVHEPRGQEVQP